MKHLFGKIFYDISTTLWEPSLAIWIWHCKITLSMYPGASGLWQWGIDLPRDFNNKFDIDDEPEIKDIVTTEFFLILSCPLIKLQIYYLRTEKTDE
ncbi:MAG: hypothetical protein SXA11_06870 [Cyanobacteriota bacterium]|nr:hypothetical protein [Cyanobacteriota bacterium]